MNHASSADWEMAIVLPLGAVAHQLQRIESQLRLLNMKAFSFATDQENRTVRSRVNDRLEQIRQALESIADLVSDIEADIQPESGVVTRAIGLDARLSKIPGAPVDEESGPADAPSTWRTPYKVHPDRDD